MVVVEKIKCYHAPCGWNFSCGDRCLWQSDGRCYVGDWDYSAGMTDLKGKKMGHIINRKVFNSLEDALDYMIQRP